MNLLEDKENKLWKYTKIIYLYTNKINNKKYVGQVNSNTKNLYKRHLEHMRNNLLIDNKLREYGEENFSLEIIHIAETLEELNYFEEFYIKYYDTLAKNNKGYNIAIGGHHKGNTLAGMSQEEKDLIFKDKERCKKISETQKRTKRSEESNEKRRKTLLEQRENKEAIINVGKLWNKYKSVNKIIEETNLHRSTVCRYLKKCNELGITNYDGSKETSIYNPIKVIVIDKNGNQYLFNSIKQCENDSMKIFGVKFSHINRYINKKTYKGFIFKSVE